MEHSEAQKRVEAYADNELAPGAATAFEAHLETCADCREQLGTVMANRRVLADALDPGAAPAALRARIAGITSASARPNLAHRRAAPAWWLQAAALAGVAILSSGATFAVLGRQDGGRVQTLMDAHVRAQDPGKAIEVVSSDRHTVKPWLDARLDFAPPVTDFAAQGFPLLGGRLDYVEGRRAAVMVYGRRKHTVDVFVRPSGDGPPPPRSADRRGYHLIGWRKGGFDWWAVSDVDADELKALRQLIEKDGADHSGRS
ncbi:MAG: anti-sigma factor [Proteobacteria bacterium]|nr:anti-sigma factor [Pseudomonadota bacterium]